jgi:putative PIN family toxin of toxin-antitoxin system
VVNPPDKPRCVFDCVVFLQAAVSRKGPAFAALTLAEAGKIELLLSRDVLAEVNDVLLRPQVAKKFPHLSPDVVQSFLRQLENIGCWVEDVPQTFRLDRDPDDERYINLAIVGGAHIL